MGKSKCPYALSENLIFITWKNRDVWRQDRIFPGDKTELVKNHKTRTVSGKPELMGQLFLISYFSVACHFSSHLISLISLIFVSKFVCILPERSSMTEATKLAVCGINCIQLESMVLTFRNLASYI